MANSWESTMPLVYLGLLMAEITAAFWTEVSKGEHVPLCHLPGSNARTPDIEDIGKKNTKSAA